MIYDEPRFAPGGDCFLNVEFGDDGNLELSFVALGLMQAVRTQAIQGVVDMTPSYSSLLVEYEPDDISLDDLRRELSALLASLGSTDDIELMSRVAYVPCCYLDPWTKAAIEDYCEKITPREFDPDFVARINGLEDRHQLVRVQSGTDHWVASVAAIPGCALMRPLDPRCLLTSPKYNPPRMWTPANSICTGGMSTSIHPLRVPGGYNLIGRTPVPVYEPSQETSIFRDQVTLVQPADRVKFVPIDVDEYKRIRASLKAGTYEYNVTGYSKFSVRAYKDWTATLDTAARF